MLRGDQKTCNTSWVFQLDLIEGASRNLSDKSLEFRLLKFDMKILLLAYTLDRGDQNTCNTIDQLR